MPNTVRFLLSGNDLQKVIIASILVEDVLPGAPAGSPAPGSMRISFRQYDPGPVQIRPLLPGSMLFLADAAASGTIPNPEIDSFTPADYAGWRTTGRILVTVTERTGAEISAIAPDLPVKPNRLWYGPVQLPPNFLFETLTTKLDKAIIVTADGRTIRPTHADWRKYAIAEFLAGRYAPTLKTSNDPMQDDRIRCVMPTVKEPVSGNIFELVITAAFARNPKDADDATFDDPPPPLNRNEPLHPRNGLIPVREVYRRLRNAMFIDSAAIPLMDRILAEWPNAPRFFPIRFTRTWEPVADCSAFFPRQTVRIESGGSVIHEERLPSHGVVYLRQDAPLAGQPEPDAPNIQVSLLGTMKWLLGGGTSWRDPGETNPVPIDLGSVAQPHVSVRLPMSEAMLVEARYVNLNDNTCTYLSLRRTVRALVDNRIAGGRLNFGVNHTSASTRGIIHRVFSGTPATVDSIADNAPDPLGIEGLAASLEPILRAFFPNNTPQQVIPGAPVAPIIYKEGQSVYRLWQSIWEEFQLNTTKRNFSDSHIGRGGPGAMVAIGLATYQVDLTRNPYWGDEYYYDHIVREMLSGLQPGALLQFWRFEADFLALKNRVVTNLTFADPSENYGHSPIFLGYELDGAGQVIGINVIDQYGESTADIQHNGAFLHLKWWKGEDIWIAANWSE
jgi:hypothetical protein